MDTRHTHRQTIVQQVYACLFDYEANTKYLLPESKAIFEHKDSFDEQITHNASSFGADKIAKIDKAILYLALYELEFEKKEPYKVIINEAVELGKEFGSEKSHTFINAVLGKIYATSTI